LASGFELPVQVSNNFVYDYVVEAKMFVNAWRSEARLKIFDMDQAEVVLRAVERGRIVSGARAVVTPLFQGLDARIMHLPSPLSRASVQNLL